LRAINVVFRAMMLSESGTEHNYVFLIYLKLLLAVSSYRLAGTCLKRYVVPDNRHN